MAKADVEILVDQEIEGIERAERASTPAPDDAVDAERGEHGEPAEHHGAEDPADEAGALFLHDEQPDQDHDVSGTTAGASDGASTFRPSMALSTEIAGVMAPSP
jgi:hypothetical protein